MTEVDLAPVIDLAITLGVAGVSTAAGWLIKRAGELVGVRVEDTLARRVQEAASWGARRAIANARGKGEDIERIDVRSRATAEAVNYVLDHVPDSARRLGLSEAGVRELVEARLSS
ncbi:hypothetical protein [Fodinicurvata sp. EGI_FJ10296]|uniref:hypothetical protein n=1 Tax=Fodinicurvata sp. EGI_FJ10296 TaxID=3231908 RepID=UPI003455300F